MSELIVYLFSTEGFSSDYINYLYSVKAIRRFPTDISIMWYYLRQKNKKLNFPKPLSSKENFLLYLNQMGFMGEETRAYADRVYIGPQDSIAAEEWAEMLLQNLYWKELCTILSHRDMTAYINKKRNIPIDHNMLPIYVQDFFTSI